MNSKIFGELPDVPRPVLTLEPAAQRRAAVLASVAALRDRSILALWADKLDTVDIAKRLGLKQSEVANRLAALRDGARA